MLLANDIVSDVVSMSGRTEYRVALVAFVLMLSSSLCAGADLEEKTSRTYDSYRANAEKRFLARQHAPDAPASGGIIGRPADENGIISIAGGLIHHWLGTCFIPGMKLQTAIAVSRNYDAYPSFYKEIIVSRVLERDADRYRLLMRLKDGDAGVTAVLDVRSTVRYVFLDKEHAFTVSNSEEIREVRRAGAADEVLLPSGRDRGYLWRADVFTAFTQTPDGLYVETETLGLSRGFPPMLGWIIEPIARRLGRKSVVWSLQQFQAAAVAAAARGQ
jgi:hypothetical protein